MMTNPNRTVAEVFEQPCGLVVLPADGKAWISREGLGLSERGTLTIIVGDDHHTFKVEGSPGEIRLLASAMIEHAKNAEANS